MKKIPVWMDCDTGTDDAVALLLLHASPELSLEGLSTVCGNAMQDLTYWNTHRINGLAGKDTPVYCGASRPMLVEPHTSTLFHGENGLGGVDLPLPEAVNVPDLPAWDALYDCARRIPS